MNYNETVLSSSWRKLRKPSRKTIAGLRRNPLFPVFVRMYGIGMTVDQAETDPEFVRWFYAYLKDGCGIQG